jgi:hypothetical protein
MNIQINFNGGMASVEIERIGDDVIISTSPLFKNTIESFIKKWIPENQRITLSLSTILSYAGDIAKIIEKKFEKKS